MSQPYRAVLLIPLLLVLSVLPTSAEDPSPTVAAATPEVILPDGDLKSPRATVASLLEAMDPPKGEEPGIDFDRAVKTLDTSELPGLVRGEKAREVAVKLYAILTYKNLVPGKVPAAATVDAIQILDVAGYGIYLERNGPNWRFSKTTVSDTPAVFREIESKLSQRELRALSGALNPWLAVRTYVPESLRKTSFLLEDWQWLAGALVILLLVLLQVVAIAIVRWIVKRFVLTRMAASSEKTVDSLGKPVFIVLSTIVLQLFLSTLDLAIDVYTPLIAWISTVRIAGLMVLGIRLIELAGERLRQISVVSSGVADDLLFPLIQKVLLLLVVALGIVQILTIHGVNVSGLVAGLGLGGLAFALAAKDTVENIFGSAAILIDRPFKVGDYVVVSGVGGTVERIGLRKAGKTLRPSNRVAGLS